MSAEEATILSIRSKDSEQSVCNCIPTCTPSTEITLSSECIGYVADVCGCAKPVHKFTWTNGAFMSASVMTYGATIMNISVPDKSGKLEDIVLGFDTLGEYIEQADFDFGATLGRSANVIADAEYWLRKCDVVELSRNLNGRHHMNGGSKGFGRVNWTSHVSGPQVIMSYVSEDGEEGYPGALMVQVMFAMKENNSFVVSYMAQSERCTPVNLSTRLYMNLAGHAAGKSAIIDHIFVINARKHVEFHREEMIPTGNLIKIGDSEYDCRVPTTLRKQLQCSTDGCFHESFLIVQDEPANSTNNFVGRFIHPDSGRVLEVYSTQRCAEFSTCHNFPHLDSNTILDLVEENLCEDDNCASLCERIVNEIITQSTNDNSRFIRDDILGELCERVIQAKLESDGTIPKDVAFTLLKDICAELRILMHSAEETEEEDQVEEDDFDRALPIYGKSGACYGRNDGFFLQMQNYPDAVHHLGRFGDILLQPGQIYRHELTYKFGLHMGDVQPGSSQAAKCDG